MFGQRIFASDAAAAAGFSCCLLWRLAAGVGQLKAKWLWEETMDAWERSAIGRSRRRLGEQKI